jgi:hypothetical protein
LEDSSSELRATDQTLAEISWLIVARTRRFPAGFSFCGSQSDTREHNNGSDLIDTDMQLDFNSRSKQSR